MQQQMLKQRNLSKIWKRNKPKGNQQSRMPMEEDQKQSAINIQSTSVFATNNRQSPAIATQTHQANIRPNLQIPSIQIPPPTERSASAPPPPANESPFQYQGDIQFQSQTPTSYQRNHNNKGFQAIIRASNAEEEWSQIQRGWEPHIPSGNIRINAFDPSRQQRFVNPGPTPVLTMTEYTRKQKEREANQSKITKKVQIIKQRKREKQKQSVNMSNNNNDTQ